MILRRLGRKTKIAGKIQAYFPDHSMYIEPFFGAGGMFFNKERVPYNILNDYDDNVVNLFNVLMNQGDEFRALLKIMPVHSDLFKTWKHVDETDAIRIAVRFLFYSNFGFMGKDTTMTLGRSNTKRIALGRIDETIDALMGCQFSNYDFRELLKKISFKNQRERDKAFIYCDPPYLGTADNYSNSFSYQDTSDLFVVMMSLRIRFAISEFANPKVLELAEEHGLNVVEIGERQALKARRTEILIMNY